MSFWVCYGVCVYACVRECMHACVCVCVCMYVHTYACLYVHLHIKTHNSESRGQEEAGHMRQVSVLFTRTTAVKFVDALNKPPLKLSLSYQELGMF